MSRLSVSLSQQLSGSFRLDCSFEVGPGINILFGPSGAGKSSVLDAVAGILRCEREEVRLGSETWASSELRLSPQRRHLGYIMQRPVLFRNMSVAENISFGVADSSRSNVRALAESVGISDLLNARPAKLSGGEQQRVALARALAPEPRLLLLDEPFSAIDQLAKNTLLSFVSSWVRERQAITIYVTHDVAEACSIGDHVLRLTAGSVSAVGDTATVLASERDLVTRALSQAQTP